MKHLFKIFAIIIIASLNLCLLSAQNLDLIPKPQEVKIGKGCFILDKNTKIEAKHSFAAKYLKAKLNAVNLGIVKTKDLKSNNSIQFEIAKCHDIHKEGYKLSVNENGILIKASTDAGAFYAVQTLLQLMPPSIYSADKKGVEIWSVPYVEINDYPRFEYRGMMLDVSRTFFDADFIKEYIDWLAYHKINKFHWHLTDDNGWRIEIKKYPELTNKGAWRGPNEVVEPCFGSGLKRYGGFYTQKEIKEIVRFASDRNIEIIPEIDIPGHSKAIIASYPEIACPVDGVVSVHGETNNVWCAGRKENYEIAENIIKEVAKLFPSKYIHIGADEVDMKGWEKCPHCQKLMKNNGMKEEIEILNFFIIKMEEIIKKYNKSLAGWDEIIEGGELQKDSRVYAWRSVKKGIEAVRKGQATVMQIGEYCYFDMKQSPLERGHNWAGVVTLEKTYSLDPVGTFDVTDEEKKLILGPQGALWTELLNEPYRFVEYQNWPRTAAIAEVGWTNQSLRNYDDFYTRLTRTHYERLYNQGIYFRLPYPKVQYFNNILSVELPYPWAVIRYTMDGSEPTRLSSVYQGQITTNTPQNFRFATFYKDDIQSISVIAENVERYDLMTPKVSIETSLKENKRFPLKNITDYDFKTYFRSDKKAQKGDYIIYKFKEPVKASKIIIETGIPSIDFYGVTSGYVEYSFNGLDYIRGEDFVKHRAEIIFDKPIKAIRIVITAPSDGPTLCLQDLKVVR